MKIIPIIQHSRYDVGDDVKVVRSPYIGHDFSIPYKVISIHENGLVMLKLSNSKTDNDLFPFFDNELTPLTNK